MTDSILESVKKMLGIDATDTAFDDEIILHINSVLATLNQLGIGPVDGLMIEDENSVWSELIEDNNKLNSVKSYVYLRVRLLLDPPGTSYLISSMEKQVEELTWRLNVVRETELAEEELTPVPGFAYLVVPIEETNV